MLCCKCDCAYLAVIIGIVAGVALGVLYSLGFVQTGIIFWIYLLIGVLGIFTMPLYASKSSCNEGDKCFLSYRNLLTIASAGTIIFAVTGLIVALIASITVVSVITGIATFFPALLLSTVVCLSRCICTSFKY